VILRIVLMLLDNHPWSERVLDKLAIRMYFRFKVLDLNSICRAKITC